MIDDKRIITKIYDVLYLDTSHTPRETIKSYNIEKGLYTSEIMFRLSGEIEAHFDNSIFHNKSNSILYFPKGCGKKQHKIKTIEPYTVIDVFFDTDVLISSTGFNIDVQSSPIFKKMFEDLYDVWSKHTTGYYYKSLSILYDILSYLQQFNEDTQLQNPQYLRIKPAIEYLNMNFCSNNIDYDYVATLSHMSYSYFRKVFLKYLGTSPAKYIMAKKIKHAKTLLSLQKHNISEVASITGFIDIYTFSHTFKKITGHSPSHFLYNKE